MHHIDLLLLFKDFEKYHFESSLCMLAYFCWGWFIFKKEKRINFEAEASIFFLFEKIELFENLRKLIYRSERWRKDILKVLFV